MREAGFAGDDARRAFVPFVVGCSKMPGIMLSMDQKDGYVGEDQAYWANNGVPN